MSEHWCKIYYKVVNNYLFWSCCVPSWSKPFGDSLLIPDFGLNSLVERLHTRSYLSLFVQFIPYVLHFSLHMLCIYICKISYFCLKCFQCTEIHTLKVPSFRMNYSFLWRSSYSSHYRTLSLLVFTLFLSIDWEHLEAPIFVIYFGTPPQDLPLLHT